MTQENKTTRAIVLLLEQTQEGTLKWEVADPASDLTDGSNIVVKVMYLAHKDGRSLRLYHYRFRSYTDEDTWHWDDNLALEVSDQKNMSWWQFPKHRVIWDLLEAVKFKTAGVDDFIDNLIGRH